jgi:antitoxin (DNA-binding transcriptional repressor) of toxin-antitoxin stability system
METITIHKAKTQLSRLIEKACKGEEIIIARGKKPVVKLVALPVPQKGRRIPGAWKGKISYTADAFDPLTDQELKDWGFE